MNRIKMIKNARNSITELALLYQNHFRLYNGEIPIELLKTYKDEFALIYQRLISSKVMVERQKLSFSTVDDAGRLVWALQPGQNVLECVDAVVDKMILVYNQEVGQPVSSS